jgi:hypothetical protein
MIHRTQGVQLSDKGDDGSNVFQPTRCARLLFQKRCNCDAVCAYAAAGRQRKRNDLGNWAQRACELQLGPLLEELLR